MDPCRFCRFSKFTASITAGQAATRGRAMIKVESV